MRHSTYNSMYHGTVPIQHDTRISTLPAHLAEGLRGIHAKNITIDGNKVVFTGGIFRFDPDWNVLRSFGWGELEVDPAAGEVKYRLSLMQIFVCITALACFVASLFWIKPLAEGAEPFSKIAVAGFVFSGWAILIACNIFFSTMTFASELRGWISSAPKKTQE